MEKGREAKRKARETWEKLKRDAQQHMSGDSPAAAPADVQ